MSDIDEKLTTLERLESLLADGRMVTVRKADDGCYEASITVGKLTETAHAATLVSAVADLCETYGSLWEPTT